MNTPNFPDQSKQAAAVVLIHWLLPSLAQDCVSNEKHIQWVISQQAPYQAQALAGLIAIAFSAPITVERSQLCPSLPFLWEARLVFIETPLPVGVTSSTPVRGLKLLGVDLTGAETPICALISGSEETLRQWEARIVETLGCLGFKSLGETTGMLRTLQLSAEASLERIPSNAPRAYAGGIELW